MARTDLKISMQDQSGAYIDRTIAFINPNISNEVAASIATAYASMSTCIYQGAARIITMSVSEPYNPAAQNTESDNNG